MASDKNVEEHAPRILGEYFNSISTKHKIKSEVLKS